MDFLPKLIDAITSLLIFGLLLITVLTIECDQDERKQYYYSNDRLTRIYGGDYFEMDTISGEEIDSFIIGKTIIAN